MPARWYYRHDGAEYGPVALPQLAQLASSGQLQLNDWVREGESNAWQPLSKSTEVLAAVSAASPTAPARRAASQPRSATPAPKASAPPKPVVAASAKPPAPRTAAKPAAPKPPPPPSMAVVQAAPVAPPAKHGGHRPHKKRSSGAMVGLALAGAGGVVILLVVAVMATMGDSSAPLAASVVSKSHDTAKKTSDSNSIAGTQRKMTAAIKSWREVKVKGGLKELLSFEVKKVAWASESDAAAETPGRLIVELAISNTSSAPLVYDSWNSAGKTGAWLVDADLKLAGAAAGVGHKTTLAPQQTIVEAIEFRTSSQDYGELRMVLPYAAVNRSGQWGYIFDAPTLRGEGLSKPASTLAKIAPEVSPTTELAPQVQPVIIETAEAPQPSPGANGTPEDDEGNPKVDVRDLIKRSREMEKPAAPQNK